MENLHATAVSLQEKGILLQGPPGAGKSTLALRLIDEGAVLISDDRTLLRQAGGEIILEAPSAIAGMLEIRGFGLARLPHVRAPLVMAVDLRPVPEKGERLPDADFIDILGQPVRRFAVDPFAADACARIRFMLRAALNADFLVETDS